MPNEIYVPLKMCIPSDNAEITVIEMKRNPTKENRAYWYQEPNAFRSRPANTMGQLR